MRRKIIKKKEEETKTRNTEDVVDTEFLARYEDHSTFERGTIVPRMSLGSGCYRVGRTRIYT